MGEPDGASSQVQNAGPPQHSQSTLQTKPNPGQQICQNYIRGLACHRGHNCRFFHDDKARLNWPKLKQNQRKAAAEARKASKMSDTAKPVPSNSTVSSEAGTAPPKQTVVKPTTSQTTSTSDTSPSMASISTTPPTEYVQSHLRSGPNDSSNASQLSSIESAAGKLSFSEWNQQRAEIAASFFPRVAESTIMVGQDQLDGVFSYKTGTLSSKSGMPPILTGRVKLPVAVKDSAPVSSRKLPVDVPKNIDRVANGIATTAGFLPFEAGTGEKPQGITDDMWAFMKERDLTHMSISTISSESSRASRKSLNITSKVMEFIHRRVNTSDAPTPLGIGHPAYDGGSEKPRVCLPNIGISQVSPKKPRSPLGRVQSAIGLGIVHEAPLSNLSNPPRNDLVVRKYQSPQVAAVRDNSAHINEWLNAAKFIAADDKAIEEAHAIRTEDASSRSRVEIVSKFVPRPATATNSPYGEALSEGRFLGRRPEFPVTSNLLAASKPSNELIKDTHTTVAKTSIKSENPSNGSIQSKPDGAKINPRHQAPKESVIDGRITAANGGSVKAELCINYVRGFPCYYGNECDRYHDGELRNATMMHPCVEYNSGELCHNRKYCTLYHDIAIHNKNRKEMMAKKSIPVIPDSSMVHGNAPRCLEFALGHECPRKRNCTLFHDIVFRNATRFANDVCFNFLLGLPCHVEMCKYRHDIDLRDTLNGVRSYRSMAFMDGACSNKTEISSGENHKHPQDRASVAAPIAATIPNGTSTVAPLCFNYILGMRCSGGGSNGCRFVHNEGLRAQVVKDTCRNFVLGFHCAKDRGCRFYHDEKLRDALRDYKLRQISAQSVSKVVVSKVDSKGLLFQGTQNGINEAIKSTNLVEKKAAIRTTPIKSTNLVEKKVASQTTPIKPPSPAKSEGAAAWGDFAAHIAADDAAVVTRALSNSSGRSQTSLVTVFRERNDEAVDSTAPKIKNPGKTSVGLGKKSGSTTRVVSITSSKVSKPKPIAAKAVIESGNSKIPPPVVNDTRRNTKLTKYCPRFHGGRYHCENGDKCDFVHDPKLQTIYKIKDPRFQNTKPQRNGAKTSQWAKNSYDCGAWSLTIVPMAPLTKAKGEFARFPLLPAEIRLKIWEFCLALNYSPIVHQRFRNERSTKPTAKYVCFTRLPPLLETCHESRIEALKYYSLGLGTVTSPPRTYINYEATFVYLCTRRSGYFIPMMQSLLLVDLVNIQHLTLKLRDWLINDDCIFRDAIWKFTSLRSLLMLISSRDEDEEFRTPVAKHVLMSVLAWQADELNPGFKMPTIKIMVLDGLEIDSDPAEYAPPATRGERISDYFHEREIQALFSSAV
ncbi:hypothetical protein V493_06663 [Pseudogymnoascus sp. VKM F-4281 (FW-2241)]|nr:hypothetical protein V493_06663 [Pseudogymnoascus sp. VKM F-4281 (FW-2241)]